MLVKGTAKTKDAILTDLPECISGRTYVVTKDETSARKTVRSDT